MTAQTDELFADVSVTVTCDVHARLRGRRLVRGRVIWVVAALAILGLELPGTPAYLHQV